MTDYKIGVSDFIRQLRLDLEAAIDEEAGIRFAVEDLEVELRVAATISGEANVGGKANIKLWVFSAEAGGDAKVAYESSRIQTVRIKLRPKRRTTDVDGKSQYEEDVLLSETPDTCG